LRDFRVRFDTASLVTVLLGWNATGKSNLLEAIVCIFRDLDLGESPAFPYTIEYECRGRHVRVEATGTDKKSVVIAVDGEAVSFSKFTSEDGAEYRPGHVFGYYSGPSARLEHYFAKHQERFYRDLLENRERPLRRLFFARPVHSQFVLLSFFCRSEQNHRRLLQELLGIEGLDSVLFCTSRTAVGH
jgi:membrane-bound inhibitor of C-type lysozyme